MTHYQFSPVTIGVLKFAQTPIRFLLHIQQIITTQSFQNVMSICYQLVQYVMLCIKNNLVYCCLPLRW